MQIQAEDGGLAPTSAEAVNADIPPKQKLKPVPATTGLTAVGPGATITRMADTVTPVKGPTETGTTALPGGQLTTTVAQMTPQAAPQTSPQATPQTTATAVPVEPTNPVLLPAPASGGVASGPQLTPTDPNNPLTAQTITPGAGVDRVALAKQRFDQFVESTDPAYKAALRDANRYGAAMGRLGSGDLRTSFGNLADQRSRALDLERRGVFTDALEGSIGDAWQGIGLAERQQAFQNQQQQQAFANELARLGFDENAINSAYGRALQTWMAGQQGGTGSNTALAGAGAARGQGEDALEALSNLLRARSASGGTQPTALPGVDPATMFPWM